MDTKQIRELIELMSEHEIAEITIRNGDDLVELRRPGSAPIEYAPVPAPAPVPCAPAPAAPAPAPAPAPAQAAPAETKDADEGLVPITCPMVGTFYSAPDPESPAFVSVGSQVSANTVVCIVEAMKVFNELKAEVSGTIEKVLVSNEQGVDYGQPLFMVRPN